MKACKLFGNRKPAKKLDPNECIALIDGNRCPDAMPISSQFVIKGDRTYFSNFCRFCQVLPFFTVSNRIFHFLGTIFSIAAASIIAKVGTTYT